MSLQTLPSQESIDTIIFDFGGVLFDIDYDAPAREFLKLGLKDFKDIYSQTNQTALFNDLETGKAHQPEFLAYFRKLVPAGVSDEEIMKAWDSILLTLPRERAELVHQLKSKFRTFILSNTNSIHVASFEKILENTIGLEWFKSGFEKVYYSNAIGIKKPHPETYLQICEWNGLDPGATLFIDDSLQHVEGAVKAGLKGYWLDLKNQDVLDVFARWVH